MFDYDSQYIDPALCAVPPQDQSYSNFDSGFFDAARSGMDIVMGPPEVGENMDMAIFFDIGDIPAINVQVADLSKTSGMNANPQENNTSQQDIYSSSDRLQLAMDVGCLVPSLPPITQIDAGDIRTIVGFLPHRNEVPDLLDRLEYIYLPGHEGNIQSTYFSANEFSDHQNKSETFSKEVSIFPRPMLAEYQCRRSNRDLNSRTNLSRVFSRNQFRISSLANRVNGSC